MFKMISLFSILSAVIFISCSSVNAMEEAAAAANYKPSRIITITANLNKTPTIHTQEDFLKGSFTRKKSSFDGDRIDTRAHFINTDKIGHFSLSIEPLIRIIEPLYDPEKNQITFNVNLDHIKATSSLDINVIPFFRLVKGPLHYSKSTEEPLYERGSITYELKYKLNWPETLDSLNSESRIIISPDEISYHSYSYDCGEKFDETLTISMDPSLPRFILEKK